MIRPGLVIFDCDGVLVDSELNGVRIWGECLRAEGFPIPLEDLQESSGISGADVAKMIRRRFGRPLPEGFMQATRAKIISAFTDELRAIEGISELLRSLTMRLCVASNSHLDRVRHSLEVTGLLQFFDPHVFSAILVERGQTCSRPVSFCCERLNFSPADCLVVEDSVHGIIAAQAAGVEVVVPWASYRIAPQKHPPVSIGISGR